MIDLDGYAIRKATLQDIDDLTRLHCASFRPEEHVPMMLGERYVKATYRWQVGSKDAYTLVADLGEKIVGLIAVSDVPFTMPMFRACLGEFMLSLAKKPRLLFQAHLWRRLLRRISSLHPEQIRLHTILVWRN